MEENNILIPIVFALIGVFALLASFFNWNWFFNHRKASFFVGIFGRKGARVFYVLLGCVLLFCAYFLKGVN
jgi:hypothetical protein